MRARRMVRVGLLTLGIGLGFGPAFAQTVAGTGLPSGFTAPGLPFGPTATVATVAAPTATMALANPGGLSFGGAGISGLGTSAPGAATGAGGLRFGGGVAATPSGGGGGASVGGGAIGSSARRPLDDLTGSVVSSGGGGAPAGAGIGGGGFSRRPTDVYFDPLSGSGLR